MKNIKLNTDGTISYEKDDVYYRTVQTIHELAQGKTVIIKTNKINNKIMGDAIVIIKGEF